MRRFLTNIFLPGVSVVSLLYSIGSICQDVRWLIGFIILSSCLIAWGLVMLCKKSIKESAYWVALASGLLILITLWYNSSVHEKNLKRNEIWREALKKNQDEETAMTDLERSAILNNDARSQYTLAYNYAYGENGYDIDYYKSRALAQKSANLGNAQAHALLAVIYSKGYGCKPDYNEAFSNIRLAIKGGYEQGLSLLSLLDSASFIISPNDSLELKECVHNRIFLDSLYDVVNTAFVSKGMNACYPIVRANKEKCRLLSDKGYYRATELLYFEALGYPALEQQLHDCAVALAKQDRIPDRPAMRTLFLQALNGTPSSDKNMVEDAITDNDFWYSILMEDYDKSIISDLTLRYKFDLAFYERCKYLLANQDNLNSMFFELNDDQGRDNPNYLIALARKRLSDCMVELKKEMQNKPYLYSSNSAK